MGKERGSSREEVMLVGREENLGGRKWGLGLLETPAWGWGGIDCPPRVLFLEYCIGRMPARPSPLFALAVGAQCNHG